MDSVQCSGCEHGVERMRVRVEPLSTGADVARGHDAQPLGYGEHFRPREQQEQRPRGLRCRVLRGNDRLH